MIDSSVPRFDFRQRAYPERFWKVSGKGPDENYYGAHGRSSAIRQLLLFREDFATVAGLISVPAMSRIAITDVPVASVEPWGRTWAILLAAGAGTRLSRLTRDAAGAPVPKQFCSLDGQRTLLEWALERAASVVERQRITAVVAPDHRHHWLPLLGGLPPDNVVVQPLNRGTAIGMLLPALCIAARDPEARLLILPTDHHVSDEDVLARAMRGALDDIQTDPAGVALLGIEADEPDPDLGYIVPHAMDHPRLRRVRLFAEKPRVDDARRLIRDGALWNSFILACRARSLIALLRRSCPDAVLRLQAALDSGDEASLERAYRDVPDLDFSQHVATGLAPRLSVARVPRCGWSDLGTPRRVAETLARRRSRSVTPLPATVRRQGLINLADRLAEFRAAEQPARASLRWSAT